MAGNESSARLRVVVGFVNLMYFNEKTGCAGGIKVSFDAHSICYVAIVVVVVVTVGGCRKASARDNKPPDNSTASRKQ